MQDIPADEAAALLPDRGVVKVAGDDAAQASSMGS